ncbi:MAG: hypothetical protein SFZ03_05920 [Candidatus Melainabacteria bacterium]|nr:hypothetical protein [Candidatus Melainabacteria bacterium]
MLSPYRFATFHSSLPPSSNSRFGQGSGGQQASQKQAATTTSTRYWWGNSNLPGIMPEQTIPVVPLEEQHPHPSGDTHLPTTDMIFEESAAISPSSLLGRLGVVLSHGMLAFMHLVSPMPTAETLHGLPHAKSGHPNTASATTHHTEPRHHSSHAPSVPGSGGDHPPHHHHDPHTHVRGVTSRKKTPRPGSPENA